METKFYYNNINASTLRRKGHEQRRTAHYKFQGLIQKAGLA
jgi:hypothetical protein